MTTPLTRSQIIGNRIKHFRATRQMTQRELSILAEIDQSTVSSFENGHVQNPTLDTLEKLARALDVHVAVLVE